MKLNKKIIFISLAVFAAIVSAVAVVYFVRGTTSAPTPSPTNKPIPTIAASPTVAPIMQVVPVTNVCKLTFNIPCGSSTPTPSVSPSPSAVVGANLDCLYKRVYEDDSRNRAGFYYVEKQVTDTSSLKDGQSIVYSIAAKNQGGASASDVVISDVLSSSLTYVDSDKDCTYAASSRKVTCTIGTLAGGVETSRSIRVKIGISSSTSIENTAEVFSTNGQRDTCSVKVDASGKVITSVETKVSTVTTKLPTAGVFEVTVGTLGAGVVLLLLGALGLLVL
ncbi:MAG: hypothetical protein WCL07_00725 [bacterium]